MKLKCKCGYIIRDQKSDLPYKGEIIRDQSFENFYEAPSRMAGEFIQAIKDGKRDEWIEFFYGRKLKLTDSEVIFGIYDRASVQNGVMILQCEYCGRIFIQKEPKDSGFVCFKPEDNDCKGILEKKQHG